METLVMNKSELSDSSLPSSLVSSLNLTFWINNKIGNNVIYFDQHLSERPAEIYNDSEQFKNIVNGTFILLGDHESLKFLIHQIEVISQRTKTKYYFDLVTTGSASIGVIQTLKENNFIDNIKYACIYTSEYYKYKDIPKSYPPIKDVFIDPADVVIKLLNNNESKKIFRYVNLNTKEEYLGKQHLIHKIYAYYYGKFSDSEYNKAISKIKAFLDNTGYQLQIIPLYGSEQSQRDALFKTLELWKNVEDNYKDIITNYTKEYGSIYKDFNNLMLTNNLEGIMAFGYFISGLIYSLNKYGSVDGKTIKSHSDLYRGMRMDIASILNYQRYIGKILCFPHFMSSTEDPNIASMIESYGGRCKKIETRKSHGQFSVVMRIKYPYDSTCVPSAIPISDLSQYRREKECLFLPFSFFKVEYVKIDYSTYIVDIDVINIPKTRIFEREYQKNLNSSCADYLKEITYKGPELTYIPPFVSENTNYVSLASEIG